MLPGTPASSAGLSEGDILVLIDGRPVSSGSLRQVLAQAGAGEQVILTVLRKGERVRLAVTLGRYPS